MSQISEKIIAIEKELDLRSYIYEGENVWPVIRMSMYISSVKATNVTSFNLLKALKFFLDGAILFFYNAFSAKYKTRRHEAVLVTSSHYKVRENDKVFDKVIDPVINYLSARGKSFSVWEFTAKYQYENHISYKSFMRPIQKELYFLSVIRKITSIFRKKKRLSGDVRKLNELLKKHNLRFKVDAGFLNKLEVIFAQASYFQRLLALGQVKFVFVVCYYDVKCFSILLAASRLGIRSVDLQHGVQGASHLGYAQWPEVIFPDTRFMPTHFYVWDENSFEAIAQWKPHKEQVLLGSNKWFLDRAKKISNDFILLSLQPVDNFLPEYVVDMIRQYSGDKKWFVRLHPRQLGEMERIESFFARAGLSNKIDIRNASLSPLTSLLERTVLHVTIYSSVAIEASYFNIPTYFLSEEHLPYYANYLRSDLIYYYPRHNITEVISGIVNDSSILKHEDRVNVLDKFIDEI